MHFLKGRTPNLKGFLAPQKQLFRKMFLWVEHSWCSCDPGISVSLPSRQHNLTHGTDFEGMRGARLRMSCRVAAAMCSWVLLPVERPYCGLRNVLHRFVYLNTSSPLDYMAWGGYGTFRRWNLTGPSMSLRARFEGLYPGSTLWNLCFLCGDKIVIKQLPISAIMPIWHHALPSIMDSMSLEL